MGKRKHGLKLHASGNWYICVKRKFYYFGKDREAAEQRWQTEGPYILKGLPVPSRDQSSPMLAELINLYKAHCDIQLKAGELSQRHVNGVRATLRRLAAHCGFESRPANWTPGDFLKLKDELAKAMLRRPRDGKTRGLSGKVCKRRSIVTIAGDIRRIKAFLNWASGDDQKLIPKPEFGKSFVVSKKALRKARAAQGRRDLSAQDIRKIIDASSIQFRPIVLLGINCGMGAKDISALRRDGMPDLDQDQFWRTARGKTAGDRRFWVWPETVQAIDDYLKYLARLKLDGKGLARRPEWEPLLFRTSQGNAWVTESEDKWKDSIGWYFGRVVRKLGLARGTFYDLRRTFETVAGETLDQMAVNLVMGHVPPEDDMASRYLQNIGNDRIRSVCEHVRRWLYG